MPRCITTNRWKSSPHTSRVAIEDIYVHPDYRDREIGGALLERIFEIAHQEGIDRFIVGTRSKETDGILTFYRSHGFTPWSIQFFR